MRKNNREKGHMVTTTLALCAVLILGGSYVCQLAPVKSVIRSAHTVRVR